MKRRKKITAYVTSILFVLAMVFLVSGCVPDDSGDWWWNWDSGSQSDDNDSGSQPDDNDDSDDNADTGTTTDSEVAGFAAVSAGGVSGTTGGEGGTRVTVTSANELLDYISRSGAYIIEISGTIHLSSGMYDVASNKTLIGLGANAVIDGGGLDLSGVENVIIQNIAFRNANDDSINVQESSHHIWIDHCDFSNGYDGLIDIKRESSYITVSWNHFYNHHKTCLLGHSDDHTEDIGNLKVTYHHNWFDGTESRHPRVRFGYAHVFNNYYVDNEYGIASTMNADVLVEGNYFLRVEDPCHVGYADSDEGDLVARNNTYDNCENGPETRGSVSALPYSVNIDSPAQIPDRVSSGAGVGHI